MISPEKCLRWICLFGLIIYQIYFIIHGSALVKSQEGEMAGIFMCNNLSNVRLEMTQCNGLNDTTTCGMGIECIRSFCGRPLFPHIGVSFSGSSNAFDYNGATSTKSFLSVVSLFYSLVPYLLVLAFAVHFLALGTLLPLKRLGLIWFISLVNEGILKNIIRQHRSMGSCLYFHSFGMPR